MLGKYLYYSFILSFLVLDLIWWRFADRRLSRLRGASVWRLLQAAFIAEMGSYIVYFFICATQHHNTLHGPGWWHVIAYVWHIGVLPFAILALFTITLLRTLRRRCNPSLAGELARRLPADGARSENPSAMSPSASSTATSPNLPTRRALLGAAAVAVPPLVAFAVGGRSLWQMGGFRVRRVELPVPTLPADLDGLTIAQVSDLHLGKFLHRDTPARIVEATNALGADLVVFTGDLIDTGLLELMPKGIDFIRKLDPRHGLAMIEGNHDVMEDAKTFEQIALDAGLPILFDEIRTVQVPGRRTPIQFLGSAWGEWMQGRQIDKNGPEDVDRWFRQNHKDSMLVSVSKLNKLRDPDAFPIHLAHHPHAFDPAIAHGFPLTLSGHTHGGQIMLTEHFGAGSIRFKYWSGAYASGNSRLFISNGIGNWFPVRVNAPAEIVHLTLRSRVS